MARGLCFIALLGVCGALRAGAAAPPAFAVRAVARAAAELPDGVAVSEQAVAVPLAFPAPSYLNLVAGTNCWLAAGSLAMELWLPENAPADVQLLMFVVDADHHWFQRLHPDPLPAGRAIRIRVDLSATATGWEPRGHFSAWHHQSRMTPRQVGVRLFSPTAYEGVAVIDRLYAAPRPDPVSPPEIGSVRVLTAAPSVYERMELALTLPDRYDNPFDPRQISLTAEIEDPVGERQTVSGFFYQSFFRQRGDHADRLIPQGAPHWRVRFTPVTNGVHTVTLVARDPIGETRHGPIPVAVAPSRHPGFVRIARADPRFFEFDDGSPFFPIGHNLRSPFDTRMDTQFPWAIRHDEGASVYERFFHEMQAHGENFTEIWMASWSLGIEWSHVSAGYRGLGQYNLMHAWELDQVMTEAERRGIYVNLVVHNHGKFSTHWDQEWAQNPYNQALGGYLAKPEDYFTDERAKADFLRLMGYLMARWGYSPHLFAWKLWNELDLTGSQRERVNHLRPEVVAWHRDMGREIKRMDPYRHLIGTHFCGDYTHQNRAIIRLPELDVAMVDAYHTNPNALHIVTLMRQTAEFNNAFNKPVLITEFGGSPYAATLRHLHDALHAGLWSSVAIPLGGAPMLWWWGVIEEEHLYPRFQALANFMQGEDRRNPEAALRTVATRDGTGTALDDAFPAWCFTDGRDGLGWLVDSASFSQPDPPAVTHLTLVLDRMTAGSFDVEFWETVTGSPIARQTATENEGRLRIEVPSFHRDLAFKIRHRAADRD